MLPPGSCGIRQRARATHTSTPCSGRGLPPAGVTTGSCGLLPHSFHPYLPQKRRAVSFLWHFPWAWAAMFSREKHRHLLPVAVSNRPALCCPDFPLASWTGSTTTRPPRGGQGCRSSSLRASCTGRRSPFWRRWQNTSCDGSLCDQGLHFRPCRCVRVLRLQVQRRT